MKKYELRELIKEEIQLLKEDKDKLKKLEKMKTVKTKKNTLSS